MTRSTGGWSRSRRVGGGLWVWACRLALPAVLAVTLLLSAGCNVIGSGPAIVIDGGVPLNGSGNVISKEIPFADFTEVEVGNAFTVDISQGAGYGVVVTADDNLFEYLDIYQRGRTLVIGFKGASIGRATWRAQVTLPDLERLDVAGASRVNVAGFKGQDEMEFEASGASRITGRCQARDVAVEVSGASTVELGGSADKLELDASGASTASLGDLVVDRADAVVAEASRATLSVKTMLDANVSGASTLFYVGNPTLGNVHTSGASTLKRR